MTELKWRKLLACCVLYADACENEGPSAELQLATRMAGEMLPAVLRALAMLLAGNRGTADSTNAGMVVLRSSLRVPVHLVGDFPAEATIDHLLQIAGRLRRGASSTICLSGSSTLSRTLEFFADLDFCEYGRLDDNQWATGLADALSCDDPPAACLAVSLRDLPGSPSMADFSRPFARASRHAGEWLLAFTHARLSRRAMTQWVATVGRETLEATNLVLRLDPHAPETPPADRSFPGQEAPLGDWVPRSLAVPLSLGRYANFLRKDIDSYLNKVSAASGAGQVACVTKAAKRAFSLSRLFFLPDEAASVLGLLRRSELPLIAALGARRDLLARLRPETQVAQYIAPLEQVVSELETVLDQRAPPQPDVPELVGRCRTCLQRVDELLAPAS